MCAAYPEEEDPSNPDDDEYIAQLEEKFEVIQKLKFDYIRKLKIKDEEELSDKEMEVVSLENKVADQRISVEEKLFIQEAECINNMLKKSCLYKKQNALIYNNINNMLKSDKTGYLKVQISNSMKDLKYRLEKCNDAMVRYVALGSGVIPMEKEKLIDEIHKSYETVNKSCLTYFESIAKIEAEKLTTSGVRLELM